MGPDRWWRCTSFKQCSGIIQFAFIFACSDIICTKYQLHFAFFAYEPVVSCIFTVILSYFDNADTSAKLCCRNYLCTIHHPVCNLIDRWSSFEIFKTIYRREGRYCNWCCFRCTLHHPLSRISVAKGTK